MTHDERVQQKMKTHNLTEGQAEDLVDSLERFEKLKVQGYKDRSN